jgi:hypothetical protein
MITDKNDNEVNFNEKDFRSILAILTKVIINLSPSAKEVIDKILDKMPDFAPENAEEITYVTDSLVKLILQAFPKGQGMVIDITEPIFNPHKDDDSTRMIVSIENGGLIVKTFGDNIPEGTLINL